MTRPSKICMVLMCGAFALGGNGASATAMRAHVAATLHATDTAHLHYVSARGTLLFDEGRAKGTMPGYMRVRLRIGATFTGSFTISVRGGSIRGSGRAVPHGQGLYESFEGILTATGGSGRFSHAHGSARLYGVFNRRDYSLVVQTTGTLYY